MGAEVLSSREIIGMFYERLNQDAGKGYVPLIANQFSSDQPLETYKWLGHVPQMREWISGRHAKGLRDNGLSIENKHFESTIEFLTRDVRRDKTGQVQARINELADRTNSHWAKLLSTLILGGASGVCYDGKYFFDTTHAEGDSGTQSNSISVDISALPSNAHGSVSMPHVDEIQQAIMAGINQIIGFKDDQGEPVNELAQQFLIMTPITLMQRAKAAMAAPAFVDMLNLNVGASDISFKVVGNARLSSWTDKFAVFRTDSQMKALICQEETGVSLKAKAEGSEYEFDNDAWQFGVDTWRNAGYGNWRNACLVTMV